jgi:hypothetical protein
VCVICTSVLHVGVRNERERRAKGGNSGARLDAFGRAVAAERARPRNCPEQAEHVPADGVEPRAALKLALGMTKKRWVIAYHFDPLG